MTTEVVVHEGPTSLAMSEADLVSVLESSIYPGARPESMRMVISYCRAQRLDPLQKPVHIVPMSVKQGDQYVWRDVIMPGIGLYRVQAVRTGEYAGIDPGEFGPDTTEKLGNVEVTFPEWCSVTVYRIVQGQRVGFSSGRVYWRETYATAKRDTEAPNAMWKKRPRGQIEKCAEALALRRAFPELGAQPTAEEMEGRVIDSTGEIVRDEPRQPVTMPQSKSAPAPAGNGQGSTGGESGDDDARLATPGEVANLRKRLDGRDGRPALDEAVSIFKLAPTLDGLTFAQWKAVRRWIADPTQVPAAEKTESDDANG